MKNNSTLSFLVIIAVLLSSRIVVPLFAASETTATPTHSGQVIAIRSVELKKDVAPKDFEKLAAEVYAPALKKHAPGMKGFFMKGDRGQHKGRYILVWTFDSVQTRDFYFPTEGEGASEAGGKFLADIPNFNLETYLKESDVDIYTDYVLIGQGRVIDGSEVIALRPQELKEDIDAKVFEKYITDVFTPALEKHAPGMKGFFMKGDRGEHKSGYVYMLTFDSVQTRDFYFPTEGEGASEAGGKFLADLPLSDADWAKYLKDTGTEDNYTDYVVLD
ncbi:MAG: hypothetical protein ACYTEK_10475 [Planctomycetota bacterium]